VTHAPKPTYDATPTDDREAELSFPNPKKHANLCAEQPVEMRQLLNREDTVHSRASTLLAITLIFFVALSLANISSAQQTQKVSIQSDAKNTKYGQVHDLVVGDVPDHVLRVFEIHRSYPDTPPVVNGSKLTEWWARGIADVIGGNGRVTEYEVFFMDNGDKFFAQVASVVQNSSGKVAAFTSGQIIGGTGTFAGMQGVLRGSSNIDIKAGFNENRTEIEYSFAK